jgi:6-phosphogluconolactonase (cycloisomerase 2 family)
VFDPSGRFILVPDKGLDRIFSLQLVNNTLKILGEARMRAGAGPRHIVFHPKQPIAFIVNEINSTIATSIWDIATGALTPVHMISTLPDDFFGTSSAAAITISKDGRYVYASNRGHDSVAGFKFNAAARRLDYPVWTSAHGKEPRFIMTTPDGGHLLVANQNSHSINRFGIDHATGALAYAGCAAEAASPSSIVFL